MFLLAIDTVDIIGVDVCVLDVILVIIYFQRDNGMFKRKNIVVAIEFLNVWVEIAKVIIVVLCLGEPS